MWEAVQHYKSRNDDLLCDFHDGAHYKQHPLLSQPDCISIGLYHDDMETVNPLGSHTSVHKLGFFYYIIKDLPPVYNSTLQNCFLLLVYYSSDRKKYGYSKLLHEFLAEVRLLASNGIEITVNEKRYIVKVALGQVSGDNLGMHALFVFTESFSANHPCRICQIHKADIAQKFVEEDSLLRTPESYDAAADKSENDPKCVSESGINSSSCLNDIDYFHVTENYTPDVMHDILEGICPYELKLILHSLIFEKKYFSLEILNYRIRSFNYGPLALNSKPTEMSQSVLKSKDSVIKQSASEMWCLVQHLPLLIGDKVPEDDSHWQLLISLLHVMSLVFAPCIPEGSLHFLERVIEEHLELFVELYPDKNVKPKQHYLLHYPRCIRLIGPLVRFWCMRFEAKHNFFRRLSHIVCNFKNICKTMALRHQMFMCYRFYSREHIDAKLLQVGNGYVTLLLNFKDGAKISEQMGNVGLYQEIFRASWISVHGTTYRPGLCVVLEIDSEGLPLFGHIKYIFVLDALP